MIHKIDRYILGRLYCSECYFYQTELQNVSILTGSEKPYLRFYALCPNCNTHTEFKLRGKYISNKALIKEVNKEALSVLYDIKKILVVIIILSLLMLIYSSLYDLIGR